MKKSKYALSKFAVLMGLILITSSCSNKTLQTAETPSKPSLQAGQVDDFQAQLLQNTRQLTFVGPKSGEGYFSPDGKQMIFQSEREPGNPFYQMYLMNLESGETHRISPGFGKTTCGWIHPSMKKVLFSSTHLDSAWKKKAQEELEQRKKPVKGRYSWNFDDTYDIFESDLNGKNLKRLTKEKGYDAEASYSPDGKWIAFASNRSAYLDKLSAEDQKLFEQDSSYMMDIYIMKADGSQVKRLTQEKGYDGGPFFSADGKKITWRRFSPTGATAEIYTMNVDGSDQKAVTHLNSMSWAPFFHPSGDYIVFTSSVYGYANFELFIVDAKGQNKPVRVTNSEGFDGLPVFTPDGLRLSWTHKNEKGDSQIFMADWDDAQARKLLKLPAQQADFKNLQTKITAKDVKTWVEYLASEEFAGRQSGSAAETLYTQQIAQTLKSWGLVGAGPGGSFFQTFDFVSGVKLGGKNQLELNSKKLEVGKDFQPLSLSQTGEFKAAPVVFAGYGIKAPADDKNPEYDSYKELDVKGKWVFVLEDIPNGISSERRHFLNTYSRVQHKMTVAKNAGAIGVLFASSQDKFSSIKFEGSLSTSTLAAVRISENFAETLLKTAGQDLKNLRSRLDKGDAVAGILLSNVSLAAQVDLIFERSKGTNVLAKLVVPGAKKTVMIGAHGDHLGYGLSGSSLAKANEKGQIHYGADDNASGVAGVMELAHAFADIKNKNPKQLKKNLLFAIWSGEEIGLLGSSHWVKEADKLLGRKASQEILAYLNMDMIGRMRDRLAVQGVASAQNWTSLLEEVGIRTGVPMTLQEDPYLPSDSMALYLGEIPAIHFFTGSHGEYHTPRDRADLINYEGEVRVLSVVFDLAKMLSDSSQDLVKYVKVGGTPQYKLEGRSFRTYLGTIPDYTQEGVKGVRISGVSKDSPAEKAGLKEKDIIVEFDGGKIENIYDYVYKLQSVKPNSETVIKVMRSGQVQDFKITPALKE